MAGPRLKPPPELARRLEAAAATYEEERAAEAAAHAAAEAARADDARRREEAEAAEAAAERRQQQRAWERRVVATNDALLDERNAAIERIAHESEELRQLFADLAPLVAVQTPAVETIAMAAQRADDRTKLGLDELRKAEEEQAKGCAVQ